MSRHGVARVTEISERKRRFLTGISEMTFCEGMSAAGLEINLEGTSPLFGLEGDIGFDLPRSMFCRMRNVAGIVRGDSLA